jgi:hypothetical protein
MKIVSMPCFRALMAVSIFGLVAACENTGANYRPVIDGPVGANYETDLYQCQSLAASGATVDGNTAGTVVAGAGLGAASSVIINDNSDNLGQAAAVGALAGLTADAINKNQNREAIVKNCMRGRGYNVVG